MSLPRFSRLAVPALALAWLCTACAGGHGPARLHLAPLSPPAARWWDDSAPDPAIQPLVEAGLARDRALACLAQDLARLDRAQAAKGLGTRIDRLVAPHRGEEARQRKAYAYAGGRNRLAGTIALAVIEARRWQTRAAIRDRTIAMARDNGEIARFRREAGLVSAVDGELADVFVGLDAAAVDAARNRFDELVGTLARLTGLSAEAVRERFGEPSLEAGAPTPPPEANRETIAHRPDLLELEARLVPGLARHWHDQAALDRALAAPGAISDPGLALWLDARIRASDDVVGAANALSAARRRLSALAEQAAVAERMVADARMGYRAGTEPFAALYVAEAAALAASEAWAGQRADVARAQVILATAQGLGWSGQDLAPAHASSVEGRCVER